MGEKGKGKNLKQQPGWLQENAHGRQCDGNLCTHLSELQFQEASLASYFPETQHVQSCAQFLAHALPHLQNPHASPCAPQTCHHLQKSSKNTLCDSSKSAHRKCTSPNPVRRMELNVASACLLAAIITYWAELCLVG